MSCSGRFIPPPPGKNPGNHWTGLSGLQSRSAPDLAEKRKIRRRLPRLEPQIVQRVCSQYGTDSEIKSPIIIKKKAGWKEKFAESSDKGHIPCHYCQHKPHHTTPHHTTPRTARGRRVCDVTALLLLQLRSNFLKLRLAFIINSTKIRNTVKFCICHYLWHALYSHQQIITSSTAHYLAL